MPGDASAADLMRDAYGMQAEAVERLEAGDWRDASEKAWCATRNATQALVMAVTGVDNPRSTNIHAGLRGLARDRGGDWIWMRDTFRAVVYTLHIEAFYGWVYDEDIPEMVRGVAEYVRRAEEMSAGG